MMRSKKSFCNISPLLVTRNLKQFWLIPLAAFLAYFIKGALPLITASADYDTRRYALEDVLTNHDLVYLGVLMILPICASVAVFAYLHSGPSATAVHAMPFSRKKLYRSSVVSGMIMVVLPILLMGITFAVLLKSNAYNLNVAERIPAWMIQSLVTTLYVYAVSTLAALAAGSVATHILLAMFFNGVIPITIYIINKFMAGFLYGFSNAPLASSSFSPVTFIRVSYLNLSYSPQMLTYLAYLLVSIVLLWACGRIYYRVRLEKEGTATVFPWLGEIVCYLFAFICTTALSYFILDQSSKSLRIPLFLAGSLLGSFLFYTVARMILEKTTAVLKGKLFKRYGVLLAALILFFALTVFDLTGYAERIPDVDSVESVQISEPYFAVGQSRSLFSEYSMYISETKNVRNFIEFHHLLVENGREVTSHNYYTDAITIKYRLKDGSTLQRSYYLILRNKPDLIDAYSKIFESDEYKEMVTSLILLPKNTGKFSLVNDKTDETIMKFPDSFRKDFNAALAKDIENLTLDDVLACNNTEKESLYALSYSYRFNDSGPDTYSEHQWFYLYDQLYPSVGKLLAKYIQ